MNFREIFVGVFVSQNERVTLILLNSVFVAIIRETIDKKASTFKTVIANGPLLYFIFSFFFLMEIRLALGSLIFSLGSVLLVM